MITIWKLAISTFRLDIPKFLKIIFTVAVDQNAVIELYNSRKSNVEIAKRRDRNRSTVLKIVNKFQVTENTLDRLGREENGASALLNSSKTREKSVMKHSLKLQNLGHPSLSTQIHHAPGVEGRSGGEALQDVALSGAYGNHVVWGLKNAGKASRR